MNLFQKQVKSFGKQFFYALKQEKEGKDMNRAMNKKEWFHTAYWVLVSMMMVLLISLQPVFAAATPDIWARLSSIMKDFYGQLVSISTIVAVTVASIALVIRMVSRNQRAVDEATSWLKRIVITWVLINSMGFIVAYLQPLIAGGNYNP